ncbi:hypothetical protein CDV50_06120 [Haematobacter massiliensis]|uniref:Membrane protein n=1 Tax=Haematobacter massiliensis TaxID=195105 RepID=A0A086YCX2_9RHOB|nr:DUF599 domain-containing protein [Haematobacter massiliensis]KFI32122.1 membrane protein [Haematobacter massiliensis]OWJ72717.1 hypothetical protein CDV50_06120 [Haematobacter massiliensis]OWJ85761.1 hypothetical protein CDV51_11005 [Haematobacter massiliensis]QBJ24502.1 DUF599 domain-containing protein [Haematobacter massiliensis]
MQHIFTFAPFTFADVIAVGLLLLVWLVSGYLIERTDASRLSVATLMEHYRREWMRQFITRTPRLFDANVMASLRQGTSFLASACMIAIGGGLALIGNRERVGNVAEDLTLGELSPVVWEVKMLLVLLFVTNAFLKFLWAHRLFGYCTILMGAVPNDPADPKATVIADQAAEINIRAARGFNRGLRSIYFALAALGWLAGPLALIMSTLITLAVIWRREYGSQSREVLLAGIETMRI